MIVGYDDDGEDHDTTLRWGMHIHCQENLKLKKKQMFFGLLPKLSRPPMLFDDEENNQFTFIKR